ncbi:hypothetical protein PSPO01_12174 [Paraphaeosphaeria sporulosa]
MEGHVDIVAYLISKGANVNHPPAQGHGRAALEAAAEWGRFDTMSLLMQRGVDLDREYGDPPQSQYERATSFAQTNGQMASKRFVEDLRHKSLNYFLENDFHPSWISRQAKKVIDKYCPTHDFEAGLPTSILILLHNTQDSVLSTSDLERQNPKAHGLLSLANINDDWGVVAVGFLLLHHCMFLS